MSKQSEFADNVTGQQQLLNGGRRCPGCGRCLECGGQQVAPMPYPFPVPQPYPLRPWSTPIYPGTWGGGTITYGTVGTSIH